MQGSSRTHFDPQGTLTRAQVVTILWRSEGEPTVIFRPAFSDVPYHAPDWCRDAVIWAYYNDIVQGFSYGTFILNNNITREPFAAMLHRYAEFAGVSTYVPSTFNLHHFPDRAQLGIWAETYKYWANYKDLIQGVTTGNERWLEPRGTTTRAQCTLVLMRFFQTFID